MYAERNAFSFDTVLHIVQKNSENSYALLVADYFPLQLVAFVSIAVVYVYEIQGLTWNSEDIIGI